ncbi:hypothetical protein Tco_1555320 [Tanacetum coccineum]
MDKTQSSGLKESIPDQNKGKTSLEVEPTIVPHVINPSQIHDLLADLNEELSNFSDGEILAIGQHKVQDDEHKSVAKGLTRVQEVLQANSELKEKVKSLIDTNLNNSNNLSEVTELLGKANLPSVITSLEAIQGAVNQQMLITQPLLGLLKTKSMVSEFYQVFKRLASFTPSGSASYQAGAPTKVNAPVRGESCTRKSIPHSIETTDIILGSSFSTWGENEPTKKEILEEPVLKVVQISEGVEIIEEPKATKTPILITTKTHESSEAQTGPSKPDKAALLDFQLHDGRFVKMTHEEIDHYLEKTE